MIFNIDAPDFQGKSWDDSEDFDFLTELTDEWVKAQGFLIIEKMSLEWTIKIYEEGTYFDVIEIAVKSPAGQEEEWIHDKIKDYFQNKNFDIKFKHEALLNVIYVETNRFEIELITSTIKEL